MLCQASRLGVCRALEVFECTNTRREGDGAIYWNNCSSAATGEYRGIDLIYLLRINVL